MRPVFTLLFMSLVFQFTALGQANFKPALYVTAAGDTVTGQINYREWVANPKSFTFKAEGNGQETRELHPLNSRMIKIIGLETFESYQGRISVGQTAVGQLPRALDTTGTAANIFLKVEHAGPQVALLSYQDDIKLRFFYREKGGRAQELGLRQYQNDENKIISQDLYKNQIWLLAEKGGVGSESLKRSITNARYSLSDLQDLFYKLNGIQKNEMKTTPKAGPAYRLFAGSGVNRTTVDITGDHDMAKGQQSTPSYRPLVAAGADFFLNREVQRLVFRTEMYFAKSQGNLHVNRTEDGFQEQNFDGQHTGLSLQGHYNLYNRRNLKFYLGTGLGWNKASFRNARYYATYTFPNGFVTEEEETDNLKFENRFFSLPFRAGVVVAKRVELSVIYFRPVPIVRYNFYSWRVSFSQVGINYHFLRK